MARMQNNSLLQGISGSIGEIVIKQYRYGVVVSKKPDMSKVKKSQLQKAKQSIFKEAVAYAKNINNDPEKKKAYAKKLKKGQTVFNAAISEFLQKKK